MPQVPTNPAQVARIVFEIFLLIWTTICGVLLLVGTLRKSELRSTPVGGCLTSLAVVSVLTTALFVGWYLETEIRSGDLFGSTAATGHLCRFLAVLSLWFPLTLTLVVCLLCISTILVSYCPTQNIKNSCQITLWILLAATWLLPLAYSMIMNMNFAAVLGTLWLTPKEIEEFKQSFHMFDQNGDGKITLIELGNVMRTLGQNPSESDLKQMIRELDSDKSGCVEFHEFLQMYARKKKAVGSTDEEDEVRAAFKTFDRDGDGYISAVELRQVMVSLGEKLSQKEVEEMINAADVDGNGRIDYSEFVKMILKK